MKLAKLLGTLLLILGLSSVCSASTMASHVGATLTWKDARHLTSVAQMEQYEELIHKGLNQYYQSIGLTPPAHWKFVPSDGIATSACGGDIFAYTSINTYFYCHDDDTIYVGADMMWMLYKISWIAPAIALAHEAAHEVQFAVGHSTDGDAPLPLEDQADCESGIWTQWLAKRIGMELSTGNGIKEFWQYAGSPPEIPRSLRDHGTADERLALFQKGYAAPNLLACDDIDGAPHIGAATAPGNVPGVSHIQTITD